MILPTALAAFLVIMVAIVAAMRLATSRSRHRRPLPTIRARPLRQVGAPCPCGRGTLYLTRGRHGPFLGCTSYRDRGVGCQRAWLPDGRRLPRRLR